METLISMIRNIIILSINLILFCSSLQGQISPSEGTNSLNSMLAIQQISVTIGGEFIVNGTFPASSMERVDQFITRIYNTSRVTELSSLRDEFAIKNFIKRNENFALRNIKIIHKNGSNEILDLAKFRLDGDFINNPYLKEGDLIVFPALNLETNFISVSGAVNKPLEFQFVEGDDLHTAILFSRGIDQSYKNVTNATISRLSNKGREEEIIEVNLNSNIKLQNGDRIAVLFEERNNYNFKVHVLGEVNQPGEIHIAKNSTTLKEVIEKVGGFTESASLKFSEVIRNYDSFYSLRKKTIEKKIEEETLSGEEQKNLLSSNLLEFLKMYRVANLELGDTLFFGIDNKLRAMNGYSQLDFRNLNIDSSYESNYVLNDGDLIIIPQEPNEVYLWGGVSKTGYYNYDSTMTVWDYIDLAGGLAEIAYGEDEVYLIKGKSRNWINVSDKNDIKLEAGDFIYAKKEVPKNFGFYINRVAAYAGIIGSIATIYLLLNQIGK